MSKLAQGLDWVITRSLIVLMALIVLTVCWQVMSRYLLQSPSSGSEELARFLLIWIGLLGAVYCYRTKAHLGVNILTNKMAPSQQLVAALLTHVIVQIFAISTLVIGGYNLVNMALEPVQISAALGLKVAYVYAVLPLSGILFCLYGAVAIVEILQHGVAALEETEHGN